MIWKDCTYRMGTAALNTETWEGTNQRYKIMLSAT